MRPTTFGIWRTLNFSARSGDTKRRGYRASATHRPFLSPALLKCPLPLRDRHRATALAPPETSGLVVLVSAGQGEVLNGSVVRAAVAVGPS
jgi:hypothetical protein